ncbi:hypothetical protein KKH43_03220 [Patescibacteria group bacterium]|nr:hypothetical protein [Patescibacteria group bacterium]
MQKNYSERLDFQESDSFNLPDFTITYLGRYKVTRGPQIPFVYADYELKAEDEKMIISYTSGAGIIGPDYFELGGKKWILDPLMFKGAMTIYPFDQYDGPAKPGRSKINRDYTKNAIEIEDLGK